MSKQRLLIIAIAVILLSNLSILAKVMYNRANIVSSVELSEREFFRISGSPQLFDYGLYLDWTTPSESFNGLSSTKEAIKQLGFSENCRPYKESKTAYALLQLNGNAFQTDYALNTQRLEQELAAKKEEQREYYKDQLALWKNKKTRLYAIAVHSNPQHLYAMRRNPQQEFVTKAHISAHCENNRISIHRIYPRKLTLGKQFSPLTPDDKFKLVMHIGALGDAWIQSLEKTP